MGDEKVKPKSYSYWCFTCKRKVRAEDVIREQAQLKREPATTQSFEGENKPKKGRQIIICPYCGTKIRRNYKVWCLYCQRIVKASELILHRTIDGRIVRICRFCGLEKTFRKEKPVP
ncbi:MAG: hypothetical protein ACE5I5_10310 [Candidatus Heimdallarchaeota archaeon]